MDRLPGMRRYHLREISTDERLRARTGIGLTELDGAACGNRKALPVDTRFLTSFA
jgi:hypothetical protein